MATDVQKIISLSLNKIMASRSRRGGISLHRNLLVAGVLLRAKDAYIAETVAKRKQELDDQQVVPMCSNNDTLDTTSELRHDDMESGDISDYDLNSPSAISNCDNTDNSCDSMDSNELNNLQICDSATSNTDNREIAKENLDPVNEMCEISANQEAVVSSSTCKRKRAFSELEIAVSSIQVQDSCSNIYNYCQNCVKHHCSKVQKLDSIENKCTCGDQITPSNDVICSSDDVILDMGDFSSEMKIGDLKERSYSEELNRKCYDDSQTVLFTAPDIAMTHQNFPPLLVATM